LAPDVALFLLAVALGLSLLFAGGAAYWLWKRRRKRRPRLPRRLRYPVVLAHGVMGFDMLSFGRARAEYFRGVGERLRRMGSQVYALKVSPSRSIAHRAEQLRQMVNLLDADRVNIVAHSMGGLDARYAIARLGLHNRVASLITIGTPHHGTPLADLGTSLLGDRLGLKRLVSALGMDVEGFYDLTVRKMEGFNSEVPDHKHVMYASYGAAVSRSVGMNPLLLPTYLFLNEKVGPNDGVVPLDSQRWGELLGTIDADHWAQIGWSRGFDAPAFYAAAVEELIARGL
jgi:triacylglycerol lipase